MDVILSVPIIRILSSAGQHNTLMNNKHTVISNAALNFAINYFKMNYSSCNIFNM